MTHKSKIILYLVIWCLLSLSMPAAGWCQSAYEQLREAAGQQQGNIPEPGVLVCAGCGLKNNNHTKDCPYANKESISSKTVNPAIAGMLAKQLRLERVWAETIQKIDREIQKCDNDITLANTIIFKAQKAGKMEAEMLARQALNKAQKLKQDHFEKKRIAEQQLRQVKATEKNLSRSLMDGSAPADVRSVVSRSTGEVSLLRANSGLKATPLTGNNVGYLNDPSLGYGKIPEDRKIAPTGTEVINSINALAKQQGWSEEKLTRLNKALCNLDLADKDYLVGKDTEVTKVWNDVEARSLDKILARDLSQGQGPTLPPGAGQQQTNQDCTIFALANATRLPYGVVAARATDLIREAGYHSAGEKADPQKTIEAKGLNGGEVTMLAETFGRAEVVPPAAFADTLKQGRPVLVGLVYPTRDPNSDPLAQHQVVLTKTFLHEGARWYEMMNSHQGPWERQYLSEKELRAILYAKGVAYSPEPGTVVKPLK